MTAGQVSFFGVRHHGPGSARRLLGALETLQPAALLVEGPADATELLHYVGQEDLRTPVALLCYPKDEPENARFWPFAVFSPEFQAILWANEHGVPVRFIDLPSTARFADEEPAEQDNESREEAARENTDPLVRDPLGALADAAGYEDGESWWNDVIEEGGEAGLQPSQVFDAVSDAMTTLRENRGEPDLREARREAHMRLCISEAVKNADGPVAVVCGAWHVPALKIRQPMKHDRALLKGMKKPKPAMTWAPWTAPRLALQSGYGAGITAPAWCRHLWECPNEMATRWLARVARLLRANGHIVSTASLIEAERLAIALCVLRDRSTPGFEELRDAAISCLCFGETLLWRTIEPELLVGNDVGEIPDAVPLAPLLEDLKRCQARARLKPEALERELAVDLRSESGLYRSTLLHRLLVLDVPWGQLLDAGRSRGTFRERWKLLWEPEYAVRLVEQLVHGSTIERAANSLLSDRMNREKALGAMSRLVEQALIADLQPAVVRGIDLLDQRAAHSDDCLDVLGAIPPIANTIRYGEARGVGLGHLPVLADRLIVQAAIALRYSSRNLDGKAAAGLCSALTDADRGLELIEAGGETLAAWHRGLRETLDDRQATPLVAGRVASLLYRRGLLSEDDAALLLQRRLSPAVSSLKAAGFFEGFFQDAARQLVYDDGLRAAVSAWLVGLEESDFVENLPLFRRVFADLDAMERRRLIDSVVKRRARPTGLVLLDDGGAAWKTHFAVLRDLLTAKEAGA